MIKMMSRRAVQLSGGSFDGRPQLPGVAARSKSRSCHHTHVVVLATKNSYSNHDRLLEGCRFPKVAASSCQ